MLPVCALGRRLGLSVGAVRSMASLCGDDEVVRCRQMSMICVHVVCMLYGAEKGRRTPAQGSSHCNGRVARPLYTRLAGGSSCARPNTFDGTLYSQGAQGEAEPRAGTSNHERATSRPGPA
eukprot:6095379-Prymnesium_polylepis.1